MDSSSENISATSQDALSEEASPQSPMLASLPTHLQEYLGNPMSYHKKYIRKSESKSSSSNSTCSNSSVIEISNMVEEPNSTPVRNDSYNLDDSVSSKCSENDTRLDLNDAERHDNQPMEVDTPLQLCQNKRRTKSEQLAHQEKLIMLERDMELERERMKMVNSKGEGLPGVLSHLQVEEVSKTKFGRFNVTFSSYTTDGVTSHVLKKGDNISIYSGGALCRDEDYIADGVILSQSSVDIVVTIDSKLNFEDLSSYSLKHHPTLENIRRILEGIHAVEYMHGPGFHLISCLFGENEPLPPLPVLPKVLCDSNGKLKYYNKNLDKSQRESVKFVIKQQDLAVIHGPPGTGKTTTLVEIILQHVKMGLKVLALAPSNLGIDNLVERLDTVGLKVVRIGHPARTTPATQRHTLDALLHNNDGCTVIGDIMSDIKYYEKKLPSAHSDERRAIYKKLKLLRKEMYERQDKQTKELVRSADVVLCTLLSAHEKGALRHLPSDHFGLTVIDECSQGTEASCYLGVVRSPKLLLAGDHKQLPPTVLSPDASDLLTSLMERIIDLYGSRVMRLLTVQYRMHEDIMRWSSKVMYNGKLVAHPSVKQRLLSDLPDVKNDHHDICCPLLLVDTSYCPGFEESDDDGCGPVSKCNDGEANLVLALVRRLLASGLREKHIAVITPYSRQVRVVRSLVNNDFPDVEIQTVDGFQGREKEAVILTLVRSNDKGEIGFLAEDRRLNVAVTRAKRHLSVICSTATLSQNSFLESFVKYMMNNAKVVRAEAMDEDNCITLTADFRKIEISQYFDNISASSSKNKKSELIEKTPEQIALEELERKNRKIAQFTDTMTKFLSSSNYKHYFSTKLSAYDRMLAHDVAESLNLEHYSVGEGDKRKLVVAKKAALKHHEDRRNSSGSSGSSSRNDYNDDDKRRHSKKYSKEYFYPRKISASNEAAGSKAVKTKTIESRPAEKHCTLCGKNVPYENFTSHRLACERKEREAIALHNYKLETKKREAELQAAEKPHSKKTKQNRNKSHKKTGNVEEEDDDDFDSVVSSFASSNKRCNFKNCKDNNSLLLQACKWCHTSFCLKHFIAEAHGCGAHAKQDARATVLREGVIYPGSGVPSKLPSADRKAQLQRSLHSTLDKMEQGRKVKPKRKK